MPNCASVLFIMLALPLMSPTPGRPLSRSAVKAAAAYIAPKGSWFRRRRDRADRLHRRRAPRQPPDARRAAVREHALQRRQRRGHRRVLHAVRLHLPDDPVLPVRPDLQPAVHRRAPAAVAVSVAVGSTIGPRLAIRLGTKAVVTAGLALVAIFYFWVASDVTPTLGYGAIAMQMVVYGLGLGLTSGCRAGASYRGSGGRSLGARGQQ